MLTFTKISIPRVVFVLCIKWHSPFHVPLSAQSLALKYVLLPKLLNRCVIFRKLVAQKLLSNLLQIEEVVGI